LTQKKPKNELVFDNKKREEFLTGFTKRKQQRKKKAQEENDRKLKEEVKRIRDETKNFKEKFKQSFKPIAELDEVLRDTDDSEDEKKGFETEDVTVTISTIKPDELVKRNFIGYRKVQQSESEESEEEEPAVDANSIPGMETSVKKKRSKGITDESFKKLTEKLKTEKDVKKMIKEQAKTAMKKSKIIKMKNDLNHKKNVKLSQRKKFLKEKKLRKHKKIPRHKKK